MKRGLTMMLFMMMAGVACNDVTQTARIDSTENGAATTNADGAQVNDNTPPAPNNVPDTVKRCYNYIKNRDTVRLQVLQSGNEINGRMDYRLYQKDGNHGVIHGNAVGDTLIVDYTFQAEGTVSTRQEVLIRQTDGYVLATGEQKMAGDRLVFTDHSKIKAGPVVLTMTDCKK